MLRRIIREGEKDKTDLVYSGVLYEGKVRDVIPLLGQHPLFRLEERIKQVLRHGI